MICVQRCGFKLLCRLTNAQQTNSAGIGKWGAVRYSNISENSNYSDVSLWIHWNLEVLGVSRKFSVDL